MYTLALKQSFTAEHSLTSPGAGPEALPHAHRYEMTVELEGCRLDGHGYLCDVVLLKEAAGGAVSRYAGALLNRLPEFEGLNPSMEHLARILCSRITQAVAAENISAVTVRIAEDAQASAAFRQER